METQAKKKRLWLAWSLTVIIWFIAGPIEVPGVNLIPAMWRGYAAAAILLIQLVGPGRRFVPGLFKSPRQIAELPLLMSSWAILLTMTSSVLHFASYLLQAQTGPLKLHFYDASFLISFYLLTVFLIESSDRWEQLQALKKLSLTRAMTAKLKLAQQSRAPMLEKSIRRLPSLCFTSALIALGSFSIWFFYLRQIEFGLIQAATVIAAASPWILIVGLPSGFTAALRSVAYESALISNSAVIEIATRVNAVVFGKRGTLTKGSPRVTDIIPASGIDEEELLLWAASAEHGSRHPFGQAIVHEAQEQSIPLEPPERFIEMTGRGVECVIDNQPVRLGKPAFFDKASVPAYLADRLEILAQEGKTPFICCRGTEYLGIIGVMEEVRDDAAAAIESLRRLGLRTIMMTGDDRMMSEALAERLHIDQVVSEVLSENKAREINKLRRDGFRIAMVGSYPEDIPSFDESELGITLTRGKGRELPPTDVILLEDRLDHVVSFFVICARAVRITQENKIFGHIYHGFAAVLAAGILVPFGYAPLPPTMGALLSGAALLMVLLNTSRVTAN